MIHNAIKRIRQMERCFDAADNPENVKILAAYLDSGQWLRDYELDEQGLLPPDLKRGVLSQDALYNFLVDNPPRF